MDNTYDKSDKYSIEKYGQQMVGLTFKEIIERFSDPADDFSEERLPYNTKNMTQSDEKKKGQLGQIIEEVFFHYHINNKAEADFKDAGVELKTTPYKMNQNGSISAKERLVLSVIDYLKIIDEDVFDDSHFWSKSNTLLLVYYLWQKEIIDKLDYRIDYVRLFTPNEEDLSIIKQDYAKIVDKIKAGKAHELSGSDTLYLEACTKGANSSTMRNQPYSDIKAKQRAFAYKNSYMTYVLNNYILNKTPVYESIIKDKKVDDFERYVIDTVRSNIGKVSFKKEDINSRKDIGAHLALSLLGVKGDNAEEFVKANIRIKTIRVEKNGRIKENMSFPTFNFKDLANQDWEDSDLYNMLESTRFLFVIFRANEEGTYVLDDCKFWNMPMKDLEHVEKVWQKTKKVVIEGVTIIKEGNKHKNNLPKETEDYICHVRPHASKTYYKYNGYEHGDKKYGDELPDGRWMTKQCFWLNRGYIESVIR